MNLRINPVLKNEAKLGVRTSKFPLMMAVYTALISATALIIFSSNTRFVYFFGVDLKISLKLYLLIAIVQLILLMFIVPSISASSISGEREKQTLDILLSTKMSSLSIIIGKLLASISKVIILIVATLPAYGVCFLVGGVSVRNLIELGGFLIVTTFFVGAIGIFYSTVLKSSKSATAATYGTVLVIFIGIIVLAFAVYNYEISNSVKDTVISFPKWAFFSPLTGLISLLTGQIGGTSFLECGFSSLAPLVYKASFEAYMYYSLAIMGGISCVLVMLSSIILNPLYRRKRKLSSHIFS